MNKLRMKTVAPTILLGLVLMMVPLLAQAAPGDVDTTFGNEGQVVTTGGVDDVLTSLAINRDSGYIRAGGYTTCQNVCNPSWLLTGYTASGAPQEGFGENGVVRPGNIPGEIHSVLDLDGATVAAGWTQQEGSRVATIAAYGYDGSPRTEPYYDSSCSCGKYSPERFWLEARGRTGTLITSSVNSVLYADAPPPEGGRPSHMTIAGAIGDNNYQDFLVARLDDAYGSAYGMSGGFGDQGILRVDLQGGYDEATTAVVPSNGDGAVSNSVLVGGFSWNGHDHDFALIRVTPEGLLDTSFGGDGKVVTGVNRLGGNDGIAALTYLPDGKILAAGNSCYPDSSTCYFALVRYNTDGSVDTTFGTGRAGFEDGGATINGFGYNDHAQAMEVGPNGGIYLAGFTGVNGDLDRMLARYLPDGTPDPSFGTDGILVIPSDGDNALTSIVMGADNKVTVGGSILDLTQNFQDSARDFVLTRYLGDYAGAPEPTPTPSESPSPSPTLTPPPERVESSISLEIDKTAEKLKASGEVDPPHQDLLVTVVLLKRESGDFVKVNDKDVPLDEFSSYIAKFNRPNAERCRIKVRFEGDGDHLPSSVHKTFDC